jgi:hypothetical protein
VDVELGRGPLYLQSDQVVGNQQAPHFLSDRVRALAADGFDALEHNDRIDAVRHLDRLDRRDLRCGMLDL